MAPRGRRWASRRHVGRRRCFPPAGMPRCPRRSGWHRQGSGRTWSCVRWPGGTRSRRAARVPSRWSGRRACRRISDVCVGRDRPDRRWPGDWRCLPLRGPCRRGRCPGWWPRNRSRAAHSPTVGFELLSDPVHIIDDVRSLAAGGLFRCPGPGVQGGR